MRAISRVVIAIIAIIMVAIASLAAYFLLSSTTSGPPEPLLQLPMEWGTQGAIITFQNEGSQPIVLLQGEMSSVNLTFPISSSSPLYPNEIATSDVSWGTSGSGLTNGTQYPLVLQITYQGGSTANETLQVVAAIHSSFAQCMPGSGQEGLIEISGSYSTDNGTGKATWNPSVKNTANMGIVALVAGVNNRTLWFPLEVNGMQVGPSNQLKIGENASASIIWTPIAHSTHDRSLEYVCANGEYGSSGIHTVGP